MKAFKSMKAHLFNSTRNTVNVYASPVLVKDAHSLTYIYAIHVGFAVGPAAAELGLGVP